MEEELRVLAASLILLCISLMLTKRMLVLLNREQGERVRGMYILFFFTTFIVMVISGIVSLYSWMFYWLK